MKTKKQLIEIIKNTLKENPNKEVCIKKYQNDLANGRYGYKAYCIKYDVDTDNIIAMPFSNANMYWQVDFSKLLKNELIDILGMCRANIEDIKPFISRANVEKLLNQYCFLNDIKLTENMLPIALYMFGEGVKVGRKGNRTFQDSDIIFNLDEDE